jgi:hypothetical protein
MIAVRSMFSRSLTVLVCAAFLFATSAPALWRMQCSVSKKVVSTWVKASVCMPDPTDADASTVSSNCCLITLAMAHVDAFDASEHVVVTKPFEFSSPVNVVVDPCAVTALPVRPVSHGPPDRHTVVSAFDLGQLRV